MEYREFKIICSACRKPFDLLKSDWCKFHRWGTHSKLCPHCGECACKVPQVFEKWYKIHKELTLYGTNKGLSVKEFIVDGVASSVMWCSIWGVVYLFVGIPFNIFVGLMLGIVILNFTMGGVQGYVLNTFRKWLL